ncbi:hypothetical protein BF93_03555 [Brachybacterium phenoliresistens]|uniref:LTD domain-containing protein n=1 Tax=Brachybacterium phenoliresistens TaxID=396014 RepID=Z9JQL6_9MICO|nr:lamin tail domain-containing protein [Brachybacterium phenoliresistens]EWS80484.1 hypothetical protein BF93_03555 [Brachybacterium phenoliresistens]
MPRPSHLLLLAALLVLPLGLAPATADPGQDVRISEVESDGDGHDWVEITNRGTDPVDVSGWYLRDDQDDRDWTVPAGTVIAPGAHVLLAGEDVEGDGGFDFGLGSADSARLFLPDGVTEVDAVTWDTPAETTYIVVDGALRVSSEPTPGAENAAPVPVEAQPPAPTQPPARADWIVIDEVVSAGGDPGDWVELTNIGPEPVDLTDWSLRDEDSPAVTVLPAGTVIAPGEHLVLAGPELGMDLGAGGGVRLHTPEGTLADRVGWADGAHARPSLQRCPDGTGDLVVSDAPSKGEANRCAAPVVLHEARSQGEDFVELKNLGEAPVDLGGYVVTAADGSRAHEIPDGTVVAAGGLLLIAGDDLGFDLGAQDAVRLLAPDGSRLGEVSWIDHVAPSLGLCAGAFRAQASATPGAPNDCALEDPAAPPAGGGASASAATGAAPASAAPDLLVPERAAAPVAPAEGTGGPSASPSADAEAATAAGEQALPGDAAAGAGAVPSGAGTAAPTPAGPLALTGAETAALGALALLALASGAWMLRCSRRT